MPASFGVIALATGYHAAFLVYAVFAALGVAAYLITEKKFFGTIGMNPMSRFRSCFMELQIR